MPPYSGFALACLVIITVCVVVALFAGWNLDL
jgi:hypothetical protein